MRRGLKAATVVLAAGVAVCGAAIAQSYPVRPVRFIIPTAAGGSTDIAARLVAGHMEKHLGQQIVPDNRPGANSTIAANAVAKASPDGYTLYFGSSTSIHPLFNKANGVDAGRQFAPISDLLRPEFFLFISTRVPAKNFQEFVAYSKANPGKLNLGAGGTIAIMVTELLKARSGLSYSGIPYKGAAPVLTAALAGEVDFMQTTLAGVMPHIQAGKIRALLVASSRRFALLPDVPTAAEAGVPDYELDFSLGLWAPAGTPRAIVQKLNAEAIAALKAPGLTEQARNQLGAEPMGTTPEEQLRTFETAMRVWTEAARLANFQPE